MKYTFFLLLMLFCAHLSIAQESRLIQGKVIDQKSKESIAYAYISIHNTQQGTLTNEQGFFSLKVTSEHLRSSIVVSCLGYENATLQIPSNIDMGNIWVITLQESNFKLPEIALTPVDALDIFQKAIIRKEAQTKPKALLINAFLRGYLTSSSVPNELNRSISVFESNIDYTLYDYDKNKPYENRVQIEKDIYTSIKDIHLYDGLYPLNMSSTNLSIPNITYLVSVAYLKKHTFFQKENFKKYTFDIDTILTNTDANVYQISFKPKHINNKTKLSSGKIWIQDSTFCIQKIEFGVHTSINKKDLFLDKVNIERDYVHQIIYNNESPVYASSIGIDKKIGKFDSTNTKQSKHKFELFIFNQTPVTYDSTKHQSIDIEDNSYFGMSESRKKNEYQYSHIPSQDWEERFMYLQPIEATDSISHILKQASIIANSVQNGQYNIQYTGNRLYHNTTLDEIGKRRYCDFKGNCIFERTPYGLAGAKFVTKGNQFTIIHLGRETWVAPDSNQIMEKVEVVKDRKIAYTHFNEMLFPPLHKPVAYFNELFRTIKTYKPSILSPKIYNGSLCYRIEVQYAGNYAQHILNEKQVLWIRQTDYMPVCLEWHITKEKNKIKDTDIRIFSITDLQYNHTDFPEAFAKAVDMNNYKVSKETTNKKDMYDEMVEKGLISQRFADRMKRKKAKFYEKMYKKRKKK